VDSRRKSVQPGDWEALKKEFLLGDYKSVQEFARKKNLPVNAIFFKRQKDGQKKRENYEKLSRKPTTLVVGMKA